MSEGVLTETVTFLRVIGGLTVFKAGGDKFKLMEGTTKVNSQTVKGMDKEHTISQILIKFGVDLGEITNSLV